METNTENETSEGYSLRMALRERPRKLKQQNDELKYLDDLEEKVVRDKRKVSKKRNQSTFYDEYGRMKHNGMDICDCMSEACSGCWFKCESCGSVKCGITCRVNRRFCYDTISFDGKELTIKNKYCK